MKPPINPQEFSSEVSKLYKDFSNLHKQITYFQDKFKKTKKLIQTNELFKKMESKEDVLRCIVNILNKLDIFNDLFENDTHGIDQCYNLVQSYLDDLK